MNQHKFKNALLIDDNPIDNMINKRILLNHEVSENIQVSLSGQEALSYLNNNLNDENNFPDIIFLDIRMPEMDGFQFLEAYDKLDSPYKACTCIYMLSSSLDPVDQKKVAENKYVMKFLGKPLMGIHIETIIKEKSQQKPVKRTYKKKEKSPAQVILKS